MATDCYTQLRFGFQPKLSVDFAGGEITSDAGLLLLREFDEMLGLSADVAARVVDERDGRYITHDVPTLLRQRLYQIVAGYADANDAALVRTDPAFQIVAGQGRAQPLSSQPTLSRWENALPWASIHRLAEVGVDWFCEHAFAGSPPREIILEPDGTNDLAHGAQQLALFVGGPYGHAMYQPLVWTEGQTRLPLRTRLRPGRTAPAAGAAEDLRRMLPRLRRRFPAAQVRLRADAAFATPRLEALFEAEGIAYVCAIGPNAVFARRIARLRARAEARHQRTGRPVLVHSSFRHRAARWPRQRRILVHMSVTATGTVVRYYVTNRPGRVADLVAWYAQRGEAENRIKEWKQDLAADRLSCHRYRANAARLQLHTLAFLVLAYFRHWLLALTPLARATVGTIRTALLKIGARVVRTARRLWVHLASGWPGRATFLMVHAALARAPGGASRRR